MIQASLRSTGTSGQVLLALAFLCWAGMLISIFRWIGRAPIPGRETNRVVQQAYSGGAAVLLWIFLAALVLVGSSKQVVPDIAGVLAWIALPLSGAGALAAIGVLYEPQRRWPVLLPALFPLLIAGYVTYAFFPSHAISPTAAGLAVWGVVSVLSLAIAPTAAAVIEAHGDRPVRAEPGPELDRFKASELERLRAQGLDELRQMDDETKLYEVERWMHPESPVREQALDIARHLPNRQADMIQMLTGRDSRALWLIDQIDAQLTPELCRAAGVWLRNAVDDRQQMFRSGPEPFVGMEFEEGLPGIAWIATHCGCQAELDELAAYAQAQDQNAPKVKQFLEALTAIRESPKPPEK
jgi:hypothetical protein